MGSIGSRLREARERKGWSQLFVAERSGISNTNISNYERDYREPDAETLAKLADLYEVNIAYLLTGRPDSNNYPDELDDPELGIWFKELLNAPEEKREELRQFWEFMKAREAEEKQDKKGR